MKRLFFIFSFSFFFYLTIFSQEKRNDFSLNANLELNSKYVWRGIPFGNSPVIFPSISFQYKQICLSAAGGYAINGSHSEVNLFLNYKIKDVTIGMADYFFPEEKEHRNHYLNYKHHETPHTIEAYVTYSPSFFPAWFTASTYVYGNDRDADGDNYYSTYIELGYYKEVVKNGKLSFILGLTLAEGSYADKFNVVNTSVKYDTSLALGKYSLPVSGAFVLNPSTEKVFLSFSVFLN